MEGEGQWAAISELRQGHAAHERELGGLAEKTATLADDVNNLADEQRKTRHDLRAQITATEARLMKELRVERDVELAAWRFRIMVAVPVFCVILTFALARALG